MEQSFSQNSTIHIAIADDHNLVRTAIKNMINSFDNCEVIIEAEDGLDLVSQLYNHHPLPEICILDISMPGLNGYDTLKTIKKKWPEQKVIILSMVAEEYAILRMLKGGANGFVSKSAPAKVLRDAIYEIYHRGFYYPEIVSEKALERIYETNFPSITKREEEFLRYCCTEMGYNEIAEKMGISSRTVEGIQKSVSDKLQIKGRIQLAIFAISVGIVPLST